MGSLTRVRFASVAFETRKTIPQLEKSSIVAETGSLFTDDSLADVETLPFAGSGDARDTGRLFEVETSSALSTYALSPRSGSKSMFFRWLNEGRLESSAGWLVHSKYEAGSNGNTGRAHKKSIISSSENVGAASFRSVVHRNPGPSGQVMVDPIAEAEPLPRLSDRSPCDKMNKIEEDILDVLIQKLYRSLYFKNTGGYRTCVNNTAGEGTAASNTIGSSQRPGPKRVNTSSNEPTPNDDQDAKGGKVKRAKKSRPNLEEFATLFACPLCKGNIMFGYERGCRDWKSHCIDNVLRRHLATHIEIDHISHDEFDKAQVKELKRTFTFARDGKPEDLWVAAFMVLFNYAETDRHKVPSPYWSTQDNVGNIPLYPTFYASMSQRLTHDSAVPFEVTQYFRENDALAVRRRQRREELVREFNAIGQERQEQVQRQTNDEFRAAEQAMNVEFDRQQTILDERYQMRWTMPHHDPPVMQDMSPSGYNITGLQQQPPAMTMSSSPPATQGNSFDFGDPAQPSTNIALDVMARFQDSPRTPSAPVDPALLATNIEVRPSSVSPSAAEREDPGLDDSGIGMCNNEFPCDKDFVCDYHKLFHALAA